MNTASASRLEAEAILVESGARKRMAFRFSPPTIRALVPARSCGTYLLLDGASPVYVGRSDVCLRTRLATHNHRLHATHVLWEIAQTPTGAFLLEAYWFHHHALQLNQIHPARPAGSLDICPFCDPCVDKAIQNAFNYPA